MTEARILLVEDDNNTAKLYRRELEANKYAVTIVNNKTRALKEIRKNIYDLAIIDIRLPKHKEGIDLAKQIRALESKGHIIKIGIIMITNQESKSYIEDSINIAHSDFFYDKALGDINILINKIEEYFQSRKETDVVIEAFRELIAEDNNFTIENLGSEGTEQIITGKQILEAMEDGTQFGNDFRKSILKVTMNALKNNFE